MSKTVRRRMERSRSAGKVASRKKSSSRGTRKTVARKASDRKATPRKVARPKAAPRKAAPRKGARKAPSRKAAPRKAARKAAARKSAPRTTAARKAAPRKAARKAAPRKAAAPRTTPAETGKAALLKRASLFSQLSAGELEVIARYSGYRSFRNGEVIFRQGSHRAELYLVKEGSVSIRRRGDEEAEQEIARFVGGEVFGEMDLLDTVPRTASAVAEGAAVLLAFPVGIEFSSLLENHPETFARILRKILGEIARRIRAIDKLVSEKTPWIEDLKRQLHRDRLTGLFNRAYLEEELPRIVSAHPRTSLVVMKPDNFKAINDTFGHEAGDRTLMQLAEAVKSRLGDRDIGARYRGDEYCVVLPGRSAREALPAAEALRAAMRAIDVKKITGSDALSLTGSVGVSSHPAPAADAKALVARAFERMWEARNAGGDRILVEELPASAGLV
ncbi:MAG TPA: diguanylate cyclase [Spirochaetia bacterium]|nr:diguanylate cyclase [Spirochaetia bacterium]